MYTNGGEWEVLVYWKICLNASKTIVIYVLWRFGINKLIGKTDRQVDTRSLGLL